MADSLDDFFAKKDKKRNKDKGKTVFSAEALVRELGEGAKQVEYTVRKENKTSTAIELLGLDATDADWRDFEDVEKRDYTGLKVKEMSLQDQNEEEQRRLFSEQAEAAPDSTAWKMKDDPTPSAASSSSVATGAATAAAALTAASVIASAEQKASSLTPKADIKAPAPVSTSKSDTTPVSTSSTVVDQTAATAGAEEDNKGKTSQESSDSTAATVSASATATSAVASAGDKGDKQSAKQAYVPPPERNRSDVKVLEPVRLSKTRTANARQGPIPNIQDEQAFPSLG